MPESALENDLSNGLLFRVRDRKSYVLGAQLRGEFTGFAVKLHRRTSAWFSHYLAIAPADAMVPSGAERLHGGLFSSESCSIALHSVCFGVAILHLRLGENSFEEAQSEALNGLANAGHFGNVDSGSDDHDFASYSKRSPR